MTKVEMDGMKQRFETLQNDTLVAADICEEHGYTWEASILRNFVSLPFPLDGRIEVSRLFVYSTLKQHYWTFVRKLKPNWNKKRHGSILQNKGGEQLLKDHRFTDAAQTLSLLRSIKHHLFETCLYNLLEGSALTLDRAIDSIMRGEDQYIEPYESLIINETVSERVVAIAQSQFHHVDFFDPHVTEVPLSMANFVPEAICRRYSIAPIRMQEGTIIAAARFPFNESHREQLRFVLDRSVRFEVGYPLAINYVVNRLYQNNYDPSGYLMRQFLPRQTPTAEA